MTHTHPISDTRSRVNGTPSRFAAARRRTLASASAIALLVGGGALVVAAPAHAGDEYLSGTHTLTGETFAGTTTTGGAGSGGGAGLGGALFVGEGATVTLESVDFLGNAAIGGAGGVGSTGGTMNGATVGTPGAAGNTGSAGHEEAAYIDGGNGAPGRKGFNGEDGVAGPGGAGGAGGNGDDGFESNIELAKAIVMEARSIYEASSESGVAAAFTALATATAAAATAAGSGGGSPTAINAALATALGAMAAEYTALATEATSDATQEGAVAIFEASYITIVEVTSYTAGVFGNGGEGGAGGDGGAGSFGQGGAVGGDGGDGGDAVPLSGALGGAGGDGGSGGSGGFGAGGGRGGNGGSDGADGNGTDNGDTSGGGGAGGAAGFGGGVGSEADGSENGVGGGGGSAYGGAIFVQKGGTLNITGNALFDGNSVFGGDSENGGVAGQQAGSDLFIMKGATVNLNPGTGNTIVFNGSIADDSKGSIEGTAVSSGQGAGLTVESGLVVFNGANTYTGQTKITGGALQAIDGQGIHKNSNINLAGGVLQSNGTFNRYTGTASDRIQWTGSGGFAAAGGDLTVRLNGGATLAWGAGSFVPNLSSLLIGSDTADSDVHFKNAINLNGATRSIIANSGAEGENVAYLDGVLSNGGVTLGDGTTDGIIAVSAVNTYTGTTEVKEGTTLLIEGGGSIASSSSLTIGGAVDISGANGDVAIKTLAGDGSVVLGENALELTAASSEFSGVIEGDGGLDVSGGTQTLSGVNTYTGATTIADGAELALSGAGSIASSESVTANGTFDIAATTDGASITTLAGDGSVVLGSETLTITDGSTDFAGVIEGMGGLTIEGGEQTLSGVNTYVGATIIEEAATLYLSGVGEVSDSFSVSVYGTLDIDDATDGAAIVTLVGNGSVVLGDETLTVTDASTEFSGVIEGTGGLTVEDGELTLSGANTYAGATLIEEDATLFISGAGGIASSSSVTADGTFDIGDATDGVSIVTLAGDGSVVLDEQTLTVTDASTEFAGVIEGTGGLTVEDGTLTLSGVNTYTGETEIGEDAELHLIGTGAIAASSGVSVDGAFDISGTSAGASISSLGGSGTVALGAQALGITNASGTFSGDVTGTGGIGVSGGTQTFEDATIGTFLAAKSGGAITIDGGSVTSGGSQPLLSIINGGTINTADVALEAGDVFAFASFNEADKIANFYLNDGTTVSTDDGVLLSVTRSGLGSNGIVNFSLDTGGSLAGDILDPDEKTGVGVTNVIVANGTSWSGLAQDVAFNIEAGGSADFADGSSIFGGLTAEAGAIVYGGTLGTPLIVNGNVDVNEATILGNAFFIGDLNLDGFLSPGFSPGSVSVTGNVTASDNAVSLLEVTFGLEDPVGGIDYDQVSIGGNVTGEIPVTLESLSDQDTPLGDLADIELIRVGGTISGGGFVQQNRFVQYGHELFLDERTRAVSNTTIVPPTTNSNDPELTEDAFFANDTITTFGLRSIVQDETYGLAVLAGTANNAGLQMLGTYVERNGADPEAERAGWGRLGMQRAEVDGGIANTQTVSFGQGGIDFIRTGGLRAGLMGSYGNSQSSVTTETGNNSLDGNLWSGGAYVDWSNEYAYVDAVAAYGGHSWSFSPTDASGLTIKGTTLTGAVEGGISIGTEAFKLTPWGQAVWQSTAFNGMETAWVENVEFVNPDSVNLRGGLRAEARLGLFAPYMSVAVAHDLADAKTVIVDGFEYGTGMAGTRVEVAAGFQATVAERMRAFANVRGAYGIAGGDAKTYEGSAGVRVAW